MRPTEELLRSTLLQHARDLTPLPWSVDAALGRAHRIRRRRRVVASALVVSLLSLAAVTAAGVKLPAFDRGDHLAAGVHRIPLPVSRYPGLTMDVGSIYVWQRAEDSDGPSVAVLDRSTNRVLRRKLLPGNPTRYTSGPRNSLWFSTSANSIGTWDMLVQLDRDTLAVRRTVRLTEQSVVGSLAVLGNDLWVAAEPYLYKFDGTDGRLLRRIDLGGIVTQLVADSHFGLIYANVVSGPAPEGLVQLDGRTGRVLARRAIKNISAGPVPAGDGVWVSILDSPVGRPTLRHLDRRGLVDRDTGEAGRSGGSAYVVSSTGRFLLLASVPPRPVHSRITCVDPDSGQVLGTVSLSTPELADSAAVYGLTYGALERVDTSTICRR